MAENREANLRAVLVEVLWTEPCGNEYLYPNGGCPCACHDFPRSKVMCCRDEERKKVLEKVVYALAGDAPDVAGLLRQAVGHVQAAEEMLDSLVVDGIGYGDVFHEQWTALLAFLDLPAIKALRKENTNA